MNSSLHEINTDMQRLATQHNQMHMAQQQQNMLAQQQRQFQALQQQHYHQYNQPQYPPQMYQQQGRKRQHFIWKQLY